MEAPESITSPPTKISGKQALFESAALLLLSLATVGTAWCSYQAAVWSGVSQRMLNSSQVYGRHAAADQLRASQAALLDVMLFSNYIDARSRNEASLARFYSDRFRGEAKAAFEAWLATHPFEDAKAPPHPFTAEFYKPQLLTEARKADAESQRLWEVGGQAGITGRQYVLITVLLACALFCSGTGSKFTAPLARLGLLALGLAAFGFALTRMLLLPIQL